MYYGTEDYYLNYLARFLKPGGYLGIASTGLIREMDGKVPGHLEAWWQAERPYSLHSAAWWRRHWERTGIVDVSVADTLEDGWCLWRDWLKVIAPDNRAEIQALEDDKGGHLGYVRVVATRRDDAPLFDPAISIPASYERKPLLK